VRTLQTRETSIIERVRRSDERLRNITTTSSECRGRKRNALVYYCRDIREYTESGKIVDKKEDLCMPKPDGASDPGEEDDESADDGEGTLVRFLPNHGETTGGGDLSEEAKDGVC
jgi:hypothetical protein